MEKMSHYLKYFSFAFAFAYTVFSHSSTQGQIKAFIGLMGIELGGDLIHYWYCSVPTANTNL